MIVVGLNAYHGDVSAALVRDTVDALLGIAL